MPDDPLKPPKLALPAPPVPSKPHEGFATPDLVAILRAISTAPAQDADIEPELRALVSRLLADAGLDTAGPQARPEHPLSAPVAPTLRGGKPMALPPPPKQNLAAPRLRLPPAPPPKVESSQHRPPLSSLLLDAPSTTVIASAIDEAEIAHLLARLSPSSGSAPAGVPPSGGRAHGSHTAGSQQAGARDLSLEPPAPISPSKARAEKAHAERARTEPNSFVLAAIFGIVLAGTVGTAAFYLPGWHKAAYPKSQPAVLMVMPPPEQGSAPPGDTSPVRPLEPAAPPARAWAETGQRADKQADHQANALMLGRSTGTDLQVFDFARRDPNMAADSAAAVRMIVRDGEGKAGRPIALPMGTEGLPSDAAAFVRITGLPPDARLSTGIDQGDGQWLVPADRIAALTVTLTEPGARVIDLETSVIGAQAGVLLSTVEPLRLSVSPDKRASAKRQDDGAAGERTKSEQTQKMSTPKADPLKLVEAGAATLEGVTPRANSLVLGALPEAVQLGARVVRTVPPEPPVVAGEAPKFQAAAQSSEADEIERLIAEGDRSLKAGDVATARLRYRAGADRGSAGAALSLARSYDPSALGQLGLEKTHADAASALAWYRTALERGQDTAQAQIDNLNAWLER